MPDGVTIVLLVVLGLAVLFDYINGFHDTANAIATSVSTRALRPERAILLSATANFVGALTGTAVAKTIGAGIVHQTDANMTVIAAALVGGIAWNLVTWRIGLPSSSSHSLIGGLLGASIAAAGVGSINVDGVRDKVLIPLVTSPILGLLMGFLLMVILLNVFRRANPRHMNDRFRRLQVLSATYMAFSHGSNDAQKTMGVMALALFTAGVIPTFDIPVPVILIAATAISLGDRRGRLADHEDDGPEGREAGPGARLRGRDHRRDDHLRGVAFRDAGVDDARHLDGDHGRRCERPVLSRPLGRGRRHRDGLDPDDPRRGHRRRAGLRGPASDPRVAISGWDGRAGRVPARGDRAAPDDSAGGSS